ncbi:hypothetical protein LPB72_03605 [Hydrogenophaga crassostreae]|uniref:2TM domain-containing protein n=1 Tax=Hydrogenophaga crassostreae TaxID=1763535 RepID=A0A162Z4E3_9BURK|nr:2TM domain-containing protein [Hydrogenophaga crassostreae]AOW14353.1 hypothetical protein LPB072_17430 [Hydrogenophaga crassostreae]OAD43623.1 hypothetical protein LPB72_03605 [Hydrogenophaga crassostreae]
MTIDFTTAPEQSPLSPDLERLARQRAKARLGWYGHATLYATVITGLALLSWWQGRLWAAGPALGWGLGLAIHGARVFFADLGAGLGERLVRRERQRLINHNR